MDLIDDVDVVSRSEMKEEAVRRMKSLSMLSDTIDKFKNGKLQMSENGILFDLPDDILKEVKQHEDQFDEVIYHVIHSFSNIGETYECIFVSRYMDDWKWETDMMKKNIVYAYVINKTRPDCSEAGSIGIMNYHGALVRTA